MTGEPDPADDAWTPGDIGHAVLDVAGLVPGYGEVADVANAAWYAGEDKYLEAGLSLISTAPVFGDAIGKGGKLATKVGGPVAEQAIKTIKSIDVEKMLGAFRSHPTLEPKMDKIIAVVKNWQSRLLPCGKAPPTAKSGAMGKPRQPSRTPSHIAAAKLVSKRKKVAYEFYHRAGFTNAEAKAHMKGVDFSRDVTVVPLPAGTKLSAWHLPDESPGRYFAAAGIEPTKLGIWDIGKSPDKGILAKVSTEYVSKEPTQALRSTARAVRDKWSIKGYPSPKTEGGAVQYFVPVRGVFTK